MARYKLTIEYDGQGLAGWQRQDNGFSVQQAMEEAVVAFCGEAATLHVAGRTDAGVHALGQVAHVDIRREAGDGTIRDAINAHLRPARISVLRAEQVDESFHARFSAISRTYLYRIINRRPPLTIDRGLAWWVPPELDAESMNEAAKVLLGHHDFSTFRTVRCQAKSAERTLDRLDVQRQGEEIRIYAQARSFLHHQIRNIAGTLREVGEGRWTRDDLQAALDARDRRKGGPTAPACGLYLVEVVYS